ncbi:Uncharacterised protein [BD1-7 clade bacterium]|uniref:DUF2797 domain-containing protein n=1 Tax=BD1-7 clade bacterium TaxID=2029982 RepID=A0A5S9QM78_9GAMM|nr:Uncharacterised protein [BD1-7 clade bacterium]CAA0115762.1 Uncharacterised protein [BD1-7 clade bacterium]CAA0119451.1 Uncharacterised protein [BD1-7 clade bacterium]
MPPLASGTIVKMRSTLADATTPVSYRLPIGDQLIDMNALIGRQISLTYAGEIFCNHCGRKTKKSFSQGYCFPCMKKLAQCDTCIMSPEKCHYHAGTCREPEWGETNCMTDHIVYLANSSGLKVGITRASQVPTRWIDQGAVQAMPIMRVATRQLSGFVEMAFKEHAADKTNWRKMLKNEVEIMDLAAERDRLMALVEPQINELQEQHGIQALQALDESETRINFPVIEYPIKVASFNLDKNPEVTGKLMGIKGQYLILDGGVINLRKYTAYHLDLQAE